jgi:hypothetical protein
MDNIYINDYIEFDPEVGMFQATKKTSEILYHEKGIICSYSGIRSWSHHLFCQLLDLYSGRSEFNYSFGTVKFDRDIAAVYAKGYSDKVIEWVEKTKGEYWFTKAAAMFASIVDDVPTIS